MSADGAVEFAGGPVPEGPWGFIACDLDGTLIGRGNKMNDRDIEALAAARAAGAHVAICTGRVSSESRLVVERLGLTGPGVFANGAAVCDMATGKTLAARRVEPELARELIEAFGALGHAVLLLVDHPETRLPQYVLTEHGAPHRATTEWMVFNKMTAINHGQMDPGFMDHVLRLSVVVDVPESPRVEETLTRQFNGRITHHSIFAQIYNVHVVEAFARGVNKWTGILSACELLGLGGQNVVAVGDDVNDLPMLAAAPLSFAMGNGVEAALRAAQFVTLPQAEGGVAYAVAAVLRARRM